MGDNFQSELTLEQDLGGAKPPAPRLHPNLAEFYRAKVAALQDAFKDAATRDEAIGILRSLVERVEITPQDKGIKVELTGDIARMVALPDAQACAGVDRDVFGRSVKVVAGTRNRGKLTLPAVAT